MAVSTLKYSTTVFYSKQERKNRCNNYISFFFDIYVVVGEKDTVDINFVFKTILNYTKTKVQVCNLTNRAG